MNIQGLRFTSKGGEGSGWFAPPKGTHGLEVYHGTDEERAYQILEKGLIPPALSKVYATEHFHIAARYANLEPSFTSGNSAIVIVDRTAFEEIDIIKGELFSETPIPANRVKRVELCKRKDIEDYVDRCNRAKAKNKILEL